MRARNPCLRARFSRLGWNVRFIASTSTCVHRKKRPPAFVAGGRCNRVMVTYLRVRVQAERFFLAISDKMSESMWSSYPQRVMLNVRLVSSERKSDSSFFCPIHSQRSVHTGSASEAFPSGQRGAGFRGERPHPCVSACSSNRTQKPTACAHPAGGQKPRIWLQEHDAEYLAALPSAP